MRLPTVNQLKMQNQMLSVQYDQLTRLQTQASTGKKLTASSDSPFLSDQIKSTQNYINQLQSYDLNLTLAENRTNQKASIITQSIDLMGRTSQLLLYAQNETLNNGDRGIIANELEGILSQLYGLANARDANEQYLYSGFNGNLPPFNKQGDQYTYQGSAELIQIDIGPNTRINYSDSAYQIFGSIPQSDCLISTDSNASLNTGTGVISDGLITDISHFIEDQYTLSLVTNNQGQQAYTINGVNSGQVIPPLPLSIPDDAPPFISGQPIVFNGMQFLISGQPNNNDRFYITPSQNQNIFSTLTHVIQTLQTPVNSEKSKADFKQEMINLSQTVTQANNHFLDYQTQLGNLGNIIDNQKVLSGNLIANHKIILSQLSDADLATVLTDLTRQVAILQLTQETYIKIQQSFYSLLNKG